MAPELKIAHQRMSVLELSAKLKNVSEACRRRGITRTQFYEYKKRFETFGLEGLVDLPPIPKSHPQTTKPEIVEKICDLALKHASRGCNYLEYLLRLEGIQVSAVTIQKILNDHELGTKLERWLALEKQAAERGFELTPEQLAFVEKQNPTFRERHVESSRPGELLCEDTFLVGVIKGLGKVYLHAVVDTFCSYAFGFLHTSKQPEPAAAIIHNDVVPFYADHGLTVHAVLTDNGREYCGKETHPFELMLALYDIEHRTTRIRTPRTNGFVERFHGTVSEEFFKPKMREVLYTDLETLQADLDDWLVHYNRERPHQGYRNRGRMPYQSLLEYLAARDAQAAESASTETTVAGDCPGPERSGVPLTAPELVYAKSNEAAL